MRDHTTAVAPRARYEVILVSSSARCPLRAGHRMR